VPTIVHHVHGYAFHQFTRPRALKIFVALEKFAARFCDHIIAVGEQHRQTSIQYGIKGPEDVTTVLNGIDLERFQRVPREVARRAFGFGHDEKIIGSIGRLAPQKGFEFAIRAMKQVVETYPKARLVLAGVGPLEAELRAEAKLQGVEKNVTFLGFRREVPQLLAAFDIFVHPSLWEGLSISLMEAMAAGKPIVASEIWGNKEMIVSGETGLLIPAGEPDAIAEALKQVLSDDMRAQYMAVQAQLEANAKFTEQRMVDENVAAYENALARSVGMKLGDARA
jgi:glycosyltransferase involved in cell wall biosynthesis